MKYRNIGQHLDCTPFELFGYECGKGWTALIKKTIGVIARYNGITPNKEFGPVEFSQVKEKWGILDIHLNYYPSNSLLKEIISIERESANVCELCGNKGKLMTLHGWNYTRCPECAQKEINRYNKLFDKHESLAK